MNMLNLFIEPHSDDIFLSIGDYVKKTKEKKEILTIYGSDKRISEANEFAKRMNASHNFSGFEGALDNNRKEKNLDINLCSFEKYHRSTKVFCPFGIQNEEHIAVRDVVENYFYQNNIYYYFDMPYAMKIKNTTIINDCISGGYSIFYFGRPHANKYNIAHIFKTQNVFFYYNDKNELKYNPEIIVRKI